MHTDKALRESRAYGVRAIPLLRPLGIAARNPVVLAVLERAYRGFLRVRPRLQRWLRRREARA